MNNYKAGQRFKASIQGNQYDELILKVCQPNGWDLINKAGHIIACLADGSDEVLNSMGIVLTLLPENVKAKSYTLYDEDGMGKLSIAEMRDLEKQITLGEISYSRMVELINEKFTTENQRLKEALEAEIKITKKLTRGINLCLAAINGGLDGLELDNTCDVTENSFIVQQLKEQSEILTQALSK